MSKTETITEAAPSTPALTLISVLLVDDQPIVAKLLERALQGQPDIRLQYCQDPREALNTARQTLPTIILQDLVMPEVDGLEMVRRYRAEPTIREIPIIVLSTKEDPQLKGEAFALGASDYLVKLPDKTEMMARLRYHSRAFLCLRRSEHLIRQMTEIHRANSDLLAKMSPRILTSMSRLMSATASLAELPLTEDQRVCLKTIRSSSDQIVEDINHVFGYLQASLAKAATPLEAGKPNLTEPSRESPAKL